MRAEIYYARENRRHAQFNKPFRRQKCGSLIAQFCRTFKLPRCKVAFVEPANSLGYSFYCAESGTILIDEAPPTVLLLMHEFAHYALDCIEPSKQGHNKYHKAIVDALALVLQGKISHTELRRHVVSMQDQSGGRWLAKRLGLRH